MTETEKKICASSEFSEAEIELFENWLKVINSETEEVEKKYNAKYIWTKLPEERYKMNVNTTCNKLSPKMVITSHPILKLVRVLQGGSWDLCI